MFQTWTRCRRSFIRTKEILNVGEQWMCGAEHQEKAEGVGASLEVSEGAGSRGSSFRGGVVKKELHVMESVVEEEH